jgi:hypothetical protein
MIRRGSEVLDDFAGEHLGLFPKPLQDDFGQNDHEIENVLFVASLLLVLERGLIIFFVQGLVVRHEDANNVLEEDRDVGRTVHSGEHLVTVLLGGLAEFQFGALFVFD